MAHQTGEVTYNFKDHTGQPLAGVHVLSREPSDRYGACWKVLHHCGHESIQRGAHLRETEKRKGSIRCWECHPKHRRIGDGDDSGSR